MGQPAALACVTAKQTSSRSEISVRMAFSIAPPPTLTQPRPLARRAWTAHLSGRTGIINCNRENEMAAEQGAAGGERLVADRVFGVIGGILLLLGVVFLVRSFGEGGSDTGAAAAKAVPALSIVSPAAGTELPQPAAIEFDAGTPLVAGPTGWTAEGRHLHLLAGGTELMASAAEIQHLGGTHYRWTLPRLPAGETTLRLAWSDAGHRTIQDGASPAVPVRLR
jgi:hypothetical protein